MNNKYITNKKFILYSVVFCLCFLLINLLVVYRVDPFFKYRVTDKKYILNPIYNNYGIAKNQVYDCAVIGSSMVQNYDLDILRDKYNFSPIKLANGAMSVEEMIEVYGWTKDKEPSNYIINFDLIQFNEVDPYSKYPKYISSNKMLDKLKYFYSYESAVRYTTTDIFTSLLMTKYSYDDFPEKIKERLSLDDIGSFRYTTDYNKEGEIKSMYKGRVNLSQPFLVDVVERSTRQADKVIDVLDFSNNLDKNYSIVFPPYSVLYWLITQDDKYFDELMIVFQHICNRLSSYPNVRVLCFYNLDSITNLNRYSDVTHFDGLTSDVILKNLDNDDYLVTQYNIQDFINNLKTKIEEYRLNNRDWL